MNPPFFLSGIEDFILPAKSYGDTQSKAERIFATFKSRPAGTGVILSGEKGSGKTMLAKTLSVTGAAEGMPTIVINEAFFGDGFNRFVQGISQPCIVLFDEFEKVHDRDQQSKMLTLLDGTFNSKKLFVLTCNDKWRIDEHMRNRPGRIFYALDFRGLDESFIREYCHDNLDNEEHTRGVVAVAGLFAEFNFDMLKALVEEMNRYKEPANIAVRMLNIKQEGETGARYVVSATYRGAPFPFPIDGEIDTHPMHMRGSWHSYVHLPEERVDEFKRELNLDSDDDLVLQTTAEEFIRYERSTGGYVFACKGNPKLELVFTRKVKTVGPSVFDATY